jgi:hypothetical protein
MDSRLRAVIKGIGAEIPFLRGAIEELDAQAQSELVSRIESRKITTLASIASEIHRLNPNLGRGLEVREAFVIRRRYQWKKRDSTGSDTYKEHFDKTKWSVETVKQGLGEWFDSVVAALVFHNDERDTTVTDISLKIGLDGGEVTTRLDRAKEGESAWKTIDTVDYSLNLARNASKKLFFRFVSPRIAGPDAIPYHLTLEHTSGVAQRIGVVRRLDPVPDDHWCLKSDGGRSIGFTFVRRSPIR